MFNAPLMHHLANRKKINTRWVLSLGAIMLVTLCSLLSIQCNQASSALEYREQVKQKGTHLFRLRDSTGLRDLKALNIDWITFVPWGYQDHFETPTIRHRAGDSIATGRRDSSYISRIKMVQAEGFKVFLKPHIWMKTGGEKWRSDIYPSSPANWEVWKESYTDFILRYARIAEVADVEQFCIGTEFTRLTIEKPAFWEQLIEQVRAVYSGKLTYAANWYEEYQKITFWDKLDFIGVQAYFPLVDQLEPDVEQISAGWAPYLKDLQAVSKKYDLKILFSEMGYKSTTNSAIRPWEWAENPSQRDNSFSAETQANCYQAFFDTVWENEWFAGVHLWQMRADYTARAERVDKNFTPQGKIAGEIIAKGFN